MVHGQQEENQRKEKRLEPDSVRKFQYTGISVGADLISGAKTVFRDDLDWLNFFATVEFYRYNFNVEYGTETRTMTNETDTYTTQGSYFRFGPDVNFLFKDPDKSSLFLGARYSLNSFSDELQYTLPNPFWGDQQAFLENERLNADWFELVGGIRVKLFQKVWLGYTGRFKFAVDTFEDELLIPNYIPGYGRADLRSTWEFNYWIIFRLPYTRENSPVSLKLR
jgi:hypothetical protein